MKVMGSRMKIPWLYQKYNPGSENCDDRYCGADMSEEVPKMDREKLNGREPPSFFCPPGSPTIPCTRTWCSIEDKNFPQNKIDDHF